MAYLGNSPSQETVLRLEARKSFALNVWIKDFHGRPLDIGSARLRLVIKKLPLDPADSTDTDNLLTNSEAQIVDGPAGLARFSLQAAELNHDPGEYPYSLVLSVDGYSSVIVKGIVDLQRNTEFSSVVENYVTDVAIEGLVVRLRDSNAIDVRTGPTLAPGTTSFTDGDKAKLDSIEEGAQQHIVPDWNAGLDDSGFIANKPLLGSAAYMNVEAISLPNGGAPGEALVKLSNSDRHVGWAQVSGGEGGAGLDATGVLAGQVPTANGADSWGWAPIPTPVTSVNNQTGAIQLTLDQIPDGSGRVSLTPAQRTKLDDLTATPAWDSITGKPTFGSAAFKAEEDFLAPNQVNASDVTGGVLDNQRVPRVSQLRGFSSGTAAPAGGSDGDLYFQYV